MNHPETFLIEPPARTKARLACWRLHGRKVSWRLALAYEEWADDPYVDDAGVRASLLEQQEGEVAFGRRAGIPASLWFDRRVSRLTGGARSSPQPATPTPAGTSS